MDNKKVKQVLVMERITLTPAARVTDSRTIRWVGRIIYTYGKFLVFQAFLIFPRSYLSVCEWYTWLCFSLNAINPVKTDTCS